MTVLRTRLAVLASSVALAAAGMTATMAGANAAASAVPACGNSSLTVTATPSEGATGHGSFVVLFRNATKHTCSLRGYPGLDALNSSGHALAHARRTLHGFSGGAKSIKTVHVAPGQFASATIEWLNFNPVTTGDCTFSKSVATTPANTSHTVRLPVSVSVCQLQVHPTVGGTSGNYYYAFAQANWKFGATQSSANEGRYWSRAETDLKKDGTEYSTEIADLRQLISLPDADQSPAQNAEYRHDTAALDAFFITPGLYR